MDRILQGGTEIILGGGKLSKVSIAITVIASILLVALVWYMIKNPPSSLFGQVAFIIGVLISLALGFFVGMRGLSTVAMGIV